MDHVAILNNRIFLDKIISGEKSIESRWYVRRLPPWDLLHKYDVVYFKLPGKMIEAKAEVRRVLQFDNLVKPRVLDILRKYGRKLCMDKNEYKTLKYKNYCMLAFLKNPESVDPFPIDRNGFGSSSGWLYVKDINKVRVKH